MATAPDQGEQEAKQAFQRDTAFKVWIKDLLEGTYHLQEGWKPNYLVTPKGKITRANIMGVVVSKANTELLNYDFLIVDDGTGRITIRSFENDRTFNDFEVGDVVNIIGKPREYAKEIYLASEAIQKLKDKTWLEVRKKEMEVFPFHLIPKETKEEEQKQQTAEELIVEDIKDPQQVSTDELISLIKSLDQGKGVDVEEIIEKAQNPKTETLIKTLLQQGDVFEIKPGRIKIL